MNRPENILLARLSTERFLYLFFFFLSNRGHMLVLSTIIFLSGASFKTVMPAKTLSMTEINVQKVLHQDGRVEDFSLQKVSDSIFRAAQKVGGKDRQRAVQLSHEVVQKLNELGKSTIYLDELQEAIEMVLFRQGHLKTARAHIQQRYETEAPEKPEDSLSFSSQALRILERRYLLRNEDNEIIETPRQMLRRVAKNIAQADLLYDKQKEEQVKKREEEFYQMLAELRFLPNSPTLMNAGTKVQQISSCFVLPVEDSMNSIFDTLRDAALIHQRGSGTGFSFSALRPKKDTVKRHQGVAAGPVAFLHVYDKALEVVKQGGIRPGANMAVLRVDHPDVIRFIESKRDKKSLKNFNISVAVTDNFMRAVEQDREYYLVHPKTEKYMGRMRAKDVFAMITQNAWKTGDPGLLFIDEINRKHPAKHLGEIQTTNQCGEAPLLPYEGCVLGSINLSRFVQYEKNSEKNDIDWELLKKTIRTAVHFLDNVIDLNAYPLPQIEEATKRTRKFGLGIMGFADVLCALGIKYDSETGLEFAERLMAFFRASAYEKSMELAEERGVCPAWNGSEHQKQERKMRNMSCLSIAPTGTISILADASSGCEPLYAISHQKTVLGDTDLIYVNKHFERIAREKGFYSPELMRKISFAGSIQGFKEIPKDVRDIFVTAQDISPEWHIRMQATLQKHVDNSISKTINFPRTATIKDVENAYLLAWKAKCKGITIYRDGSYEDQVMSIGE